MYYFVYANHGMIVHSHTIFYYYYYQTIKQIIPTLVCGPTIIPVLITVMSGSLSN